MKKMSEQEAWLWIAAQIDGAPDSLVDTQGHQVNGLCYVVYRYFDYGTISLYTLKKMNKRINAGWRTLGRNEYYLHRPACWHDGVRFNWCLKFAKQAARDK